MSLYNGYGTEVFMAGSNDLFLRLTEAMNSQFPAGVQARLDKLDAELAALDETLTPEEEYDVLPEPPKLIDIDSVKLPARVLKGEGWASSVRGDALAFEQQLRERQERIGAIMLDRMPRSGNPISLEYGDSRLRLDVGPNVIPEQTEGP